MNVRTATEDAIIYVLTMLVITAVDAFLVMSFTQESYADVSDSGFSGKISL